MTATHKPAFLALLPGTGGYGILLHLPTFTLIFPHLRHV